VVRFNRTTLVRRTTVVRRTTLVRSHHDSVKNVARPVASSLDNVAAPQQVRSGPSHMPVGQIKLAALGGLIEIRNPTRPEIPRQLDRIGESNLLEAVVIAGDLAEPTECFARGFELARLTFLWRSFRRHVSSSHYRGCTISSRPVLNRRPFFYLLCRYCAARCCGRSAHQSST
jgi:hypothetical protein